MKIKLLISVLMLTMLSTVAAAQTNQVTIGVYGAASGQEITAQILILNGVNVGGATINLSYNPSVVNATDVVASDPTNFSVLADKRNAANGYVIINGFVNDPTSSSLSGDIKVASVTLRAVGTQGVASPLNLSVSLVDDTGTPISSTVVNGSFAILPGQPGAAPTIIHQYSWYADYDGNGIINRSDGLVIGVIVDDPQGLADIANVTVDASQLGMSGTLNLRKNPGGYWSNAHYMEALDLAALNVTATSGIIQLPVTVTDSSALTGSGSINVTIKTDIKPQIIHSVSWSDAGGNTTFVAYPWDIGTSHIASVKLDLAQVGLWDDLSMSYDAGWGGYVIWAPITAGNFRLTPAGTYAINIDVMDTSGNSGTGTLRFVKS